MLDTTEGNNQEMVVSHMDFAIPESFSVFVIV